MVLRVKLYGTGVNGDPYRCKLPTYSLLHANITQGYALVTVPDSVIGLTAADIGAEQKDVTTEGVLLKSCSAPNAVKIQAALDTAYPQPAGTFKVEIV